MQIRSPTEIYYLSTLCENFWNFLVRNFFFQNPIYWICVCCTGFENNISGIFIEKWNKTLAGERLSMQDKADLLLSSTHTNQSCVQAVDLMYSAAGTTAIYTRSKLEHHFRDVQVIRQHGFANESRYETAGQVYFGVPPDFPLVAF